MTAPRYQAWTKGIEGVTGTPQRSAAWVTARRARFHCYADRVECGDWVIPASEVKDAVLYETRQGFITFSVLALSTGTRTFQFGFNPWARVAPHLPFSFRRERVRLRHSPLSIASRAILLIWVAWLLWRILRGN